MRVLAAADLHGAVDVYEWLARMARGQSADAMILAGDLLEAGPEEEQRRQARWLIRLLQSVSIPVLYIMGNDDCVPLDYEDGQIRSLHCRKVACGGYAFAGYQYSLPFVGGIFEKPESEIEQDATLLEPLLDAGTVFVTHSPVFGILDRVAGKYHVGCRALAALLERKPVLAHIHGHVHEDFGRQGPHFNVAAAGTCRAMLVELPSLAHRVVWRSGP